MPGLPSDLHPQNLMGRQQLPEYSSYLETKRSNADSWDLIGADIAATFPH